MSDAHVCDNCLTVSPLDEAYGWWHVESIQGVVTHAEKTSYDFCSWRCLAEKAAEIAGRTEDGS